MSPSSEEVCNGSECSVSSSRGRRPLKSEQPGTASEVPVVSQFQVWGSGSAPVVHPSTPKQANLRAFLDKLARRRKKINCTKQCRQLIEQRVRMIAGKQLEIAGRLPYAQFKEVLRSPPPGVPTSTLRELVDVAKAYDSFGDECIDLKELLDGALQLNPSLPGQLQLLLPVLAMIVWIFLGPAVYCPLCSWSFVDGLYFSVMTLMTVGASNGLQAGGSIEPVTMAIKLFTAFYLLVGMLLMAWALVTAAAHSLLVHEARIWELLSPRDNVDLLANESLSRNSLGPAIEGLIQPHLETSRAKVCREGSLVAEDGDCFIPSKESQGRSRLRSCAARSALPVAISGCVLLFLVILFLGSLLAFLSSSEASVADAFVWAVLTSFTVGYGNLHPVIGDDIEVNLGRGLNIIFVLFAVSGFVAIFLKIVNLCLEAQAAKLEARLAARSLPLDLLIDLDVSGDGVNRLEFVCAALMAADRVSPQDLWQVLEIFRRLDAFGAGLLQSSELCALRREDDKGKFHVCGKGKACETLPDFSSCDFRNLSFSLEASKYMPRNSKLLGSLGCDEETTCDASDLKDCQEALKSSQETLSKVSKSFLECQESLRVSQEEEKNMSLRESRSKKKLEELYLETLSIRQQLDDRNAKLFAALQKLADKEQALRVSVAERQELHSKVILMQQVRQEFVEKLNKETDRSATAEARNEGLEQRCNKLETRLQSTERAFKEAERKLKSKTIQLSDFQAYAKALERRAQDAEQSSAEFARLLAELKQRFELQAEAKVQEVKLQCAQADMQRQGEMKRALMELHALAEGQQMLRSEFETTKLPSRSHFQAPLRRSNSTRSLSEVSNHGNLSVHLRWPFDQELRISAL